MKLSQFKFKVPDEQIAQYPTPYRDEARMLVLHRTTGEVEHKQVKDLIQFFDEGDLFIFNDTKVFPARMYAIKEKTLARIEVFLLRELNHEMRYWDVVVDPARKIRIGNKLYFDEENTIVAEVIDNTTSRGRTLRFLTDYDQNEFVPHLYALGHTPLPKYIYRPMDEEVMKSFCRDFHIAEDEDCEMCLKQMDEERYQSIFASKVGAVAAPAACMHFSKQLLKRMEINGIDYQCMTSHMSLGNFKPVEVEDLTKHKIDSEQIILPQELVDAVERVHSTSHRVCAVGTEIMRALEHVVGTGGQLKAYNGWTNKFIFPPYDFTVANSFFVNFYPSESSQLMMVAAFGGYDNVMAAYQTAVREGYRFGDYGDAMLIVD
ncbi:MAG: S-adenosylmethionine:tRNA ribosyltransferase-isomerase [Paludibacteraceae bacterium]|nr:S-adenosylmethionine:tRNA ribosyltransferase-isomerase [Paludibacteraceae bacterium]